MEKIKRDFYAGGLVHFATRHKKETVLRPLLSRCGIGCEAVDVNTDLFGTFSGEVERTGTVRETLRKKIAAGMERRPDGRLFLASEGSFGPHPLWGWMSTDLESLLFYDRELDLEIYAEHLDTSPMHFERVLEPQDDFRAILRREFGLPEHGVVVRPEKTDMARWRWPVYKGLHHEWQVERAVRDSFAVSSTGRVVLTSDLRAQHNPRRQEAIRMAGEKLIEKLGSLCPICQVPGFAIARGVPGLPCAVCGEASHAARAVLWECAHCVHSEARPRTDGQRAIDPSECEFCNP